MRAARLLAPTRRLAFARAYTRRFATAPASPVTASQLGVEDGVPPLTDTAASTASATAASTTFSSTVDAGAAATLTGFADAAAPATDAAVSGLDTSAVASATSAVSATDAPAPSALARLFLTSTNDAAAASAGGEASAANDALSLAEAGLGYWPPDLTLRLVDAVHAHSELPWWGAIAASALLCRTLLLPLALHGTRLGARMQELRQPIAELQALLVKPNPNPDPNPNPVLTLPLPLPLPLACRRGTL